jgi:hypothetical protein
MWIGLDKKTRVKKLISDVESGLSCGCICVECGTDLVAKKGKVVQHHFSHACGVERAHCSETALHRFAKEVIMRSSPVSLPVIDHIENDIDSSRTLPSGEIKTMELYTPMDSLNVTKSAQEVRMKNFQPDVLLKVKGPLGAHMVAIEVAVTHFVDEEKREKLRKYDISMVEVDCGDILNTQDNHNKAAEEIRQRLRNSGVWIQVSQSLKKAIEKKQENDGPIGFYYEKANMWINEQVDRGVIDLPLFNYDSRFMDYRNFRHRKLKQEWLKNAPKVWTSHALLSSTQVKEGWALKILLRKKTVTLMVYIGQKAQEAYNNGQSFLTLKERVDVFDWAWGLNAKAEDFIMSLKKELESIDIKNTNDSANIKQRIDYADDHGWPVIKEKELFNAQSFELARKLINETGIDVASVLMTFEDQERQIFGFDNKLWQFYVLEIIKLNQGNIISVSQIVKHLEGFGIEVMPIYKSIFWHKKNKVADLPKWVSTLDDPHALVRKFCLNLGQYKVKDRSILIKKAYNKFTVAQKL